MFIFLHSVQWGSCIFPLPSPACLIFPDTRTRGLPHIPSPFCPQPLDRNSFLKFSQSSLTFSRRCSFVGQAGGAERLVSLQLGPQESTWRLPAWRFVLIAVFLGVIGTYPVKTLPEGVHHFRGGTSPDLGLCLQIAWCSCLFYLKDLKLSITCLSSCT